MNQLDMDLLENEMDMDLLKSRMEGSVPLVLYFSAEPCTVCHAMLPKLEKALRDQDFAINAAERADYLLMVVESEKHPEICGQLMVFTVPTVLIFWEGREVLRESRFIELERVTRILSQIIESRSPGAGFLEE